MSMQTNHPCLLNPTCLSVRSEWYKSNKRGAWALNPHYQKASGAACVCTQTCTTLPFVQNTCTHAEQYMHTHAYMFWTRIRTFWINGRCTFIRTCVQTYIHTHIHTRVHTYIRTYSHTFVHTYIHTNIRTYKHTYQKCMNIHIHTYTSKHTRAHTHTCTFSRAHTCMYAYIRTDFSIRIALSHFITLQHSANTL